MTSKEVVTTSSCQETWQICVRNSFETISGQIATVPASVILFKAPELHASSAFQECSQLLADVGYTRSFLERLKEDSKIDPDCCIMLAQYLEYQWVQNLRQELAVKAIATYTTASGLAETHANWSAMVVALSNAARLMLDISQKWYSTAWFSYVTAKSCAEKFQWQMSSEAKYDIWILIGRSAETCLGRKEQFLHNRPTLKKDAIFAYRWALQLSPMSNKFAAARLLCWLIPKSSPKDRRTLYYELDALACLSWLDAKGVAECDDQMPSLPFCVGLCIDALGDCAEKNRIQSLMERSQKVGVPQAGFWLKRHTIVKDAGQQSTSVSRKRKFSLSAPETCPKKTRNGLTK